jgi:hypothetical protein
VRNVNTKKMLLSYYKAKKKKAKADRFKRSNYKTKNTNIYHLIVWSLLSRNRTINDSAEVYLNIIYRGRWWCLQSKSYNRLIREIFVFPHIINTDTLDVLIYKHFESLFAQEIKSSRGLIPNSIDSLLQIPIILVSAKAH